MEKQKKILHKLLFLPLWLIALLVPTAGGLLLYAFLAPDAPAALVYGAYFLSAYALTVFCICLPRLVRTLRRIKTENRYISRYFADPRLRVKVSLYGTLAINTAYAALQLGMGAYHGSVWFYALSGYYLLLALMRFFLLKETRKDRIGQDLFHEYLHYRLCGAILMLMNLFLSAMVFFMAWQGRGFRHHPITTIAMAAFTFTAFTLAIVNLVKYRKYRSPVLSAAKAISMVSAIVSMLTLESAMLSAFGGQDQQQFKHIMTSATGFVVCAAVLAIASYMIIHSTKEIHRIKRSISYER